MKNLPISPLAPAHFPVLPSVKGVQASTTRLGLYAGDRNDLLVVRFQQGAAVAGAFTKSATRSDDVNVCATRIKGGIAHGLVVNAGNSNAFTGPAGVAKNVATSAKMAELTGCAPEQIFIAATGVIGVPLPPTRVAEGLPMAIEALATPVWEELARTISTTDTFPKGSGKTVVLGGKTVSIAGIAKGSGMIAPNMATMLVFIFTDANVAPEVLQNIVSTHVETTFNAITVDSDTSTSDTLLVFATGASGAAPIVEPGGTDHQILSGALHAIMHDLALQVVRDGEGAQKLIQIKVTGAGSNASAKTIAMAIANSPLVKTAIAGEDANWGRVIMAVGKAGEPINVEALSVRFGGVWTARNGGAVAYDEGPITKHMAGSHIDVLVEVGVGDGYATVWTCDLTHGYISINGDYRS